MQKDKQFDENHETLNGTRTYGTKFWNMDSKKRDCASRWFGKMEKGSMRGTILGLIASMIGVGFLT